jgi:ABC-type oligopeptide transport system substrate-binding subunit
MRGRLIRAIVTGALLTLAACSRSDGPLDIAIIGEPDEVFASGVRLSEGAQVVRGATGAGLVALDAQGEIEPALADRWIIADDGKSYIFRLREGTWPDGAQLTGESARQALREAIRRLRGTSLGLDLAPIDEVRAMAARVVEIDLKAPMPDFLRLLAQPELALSHRGFQAGPMILDRVREEGKNGPTTTELKFRPPEMRGEPQREDWRRYVRPVGVEALAAGPALAAFDRGDVDVVLGGTLASWPLADPGPLSRGNLRLDNVIGLFGLQVARARGFLAVPLNREALALAIDRPELMARFNISGWVPSTRVVPAAVANKEVTERWEGTTIEQRRATAASRVAAWRAGPGKGEAPLLTIALGTEPGFAMLFDELSAQFGQIGVTLARVPEGKPADLVLVDRIARYAEPRWFLNQFNCSLRRGMCNSEADAAVAAAMETPDAQARSEGIARAEGLLSAANVYIPIGAPLRWSMVRGNVEGFAANAWAWHPLPDMATIPR